MALYKLSTLALAGLASATLPPVHIKGMKFFYENGTQFFMKGVAYQQEAASNGGGVESDNYRDPLSNEANCRRDVPLLKELGVNTIRTYAIDPEADHSVCMRLLDDAGIYVISDLSQPALSIKRDAPSWTTEHYNRYKAVVDELAQYDNTLGFFAGNEVSDADNNTEASAYVKAALRDTKLHIRNQDYRPIGVGYATNDHPDIRDDIAAYFNCGRDEDATDFWGYNIYSWCGDSDIETSGYADWVEFYEGYGVPVFFAEYGCNSPGGAEGRKFEDTLALFSDAMTEEFSGGLVYMFHQEANDYGLVRIRGNRAEKMRNFEALKRAHARVDPTGVDEDDYNVESERDECPEVGDVWRANAVLPPTPDEDLCACAVAASGCRVRGNTRQRDYQDIFDFICENDQESCAAISGNATTGIYGAYSMCDVESQLTILLGLYAEGQDSASEACDFDGMAETQDGNAESSCDDALESASSYNREVATATQPMSNSPTGAVTGDSGSGGDSDDEDDFGIIGAPIARLFTIGNFAVGAYMVVALGVGATMIAL